MRRLVPVVVVVVIGAALVWWLRRGGDTPDARARPAAADRVDRAAPTTRSAVAMTDHARGSFGYDDDPGGDQRLEGLVVGPDDQPVPGALVAIDANPRRQTRSGDDGTFAFTELVARTYRVEARQGGTVAGPLPVPVNPDAEPIVLRLRPAAHLRLTVIDAEHERPIAGALVELRSIASATVTTDADGHAVLDGIGSGEYTVKIAAAGYASTFHAVRVPDMTGTVDETVRLQPGVAVSGVVRDLAGKPVEGARVLAQDVSSLLYDSDPRLDAATTDAKGRWQLSGLPRGTVRFRATHPRFAPGVSAPLPLTDGVSREGVIIVLESGARLAGRVVDPSGAPVASAAVHVGAANVDNLLVRHVYCDDRGRFEVTGLPRALLHVVAMNEGASSALVGVDLSRVAERDDLVITLDGDGRIAGRVVSSSGDEVPEARVMAIPEDDNSTTARSERRLRGRATTVAAADGTFALTGLQAGRYRVRAIRPGAPSELFGQRYGQPADTGTENLRLVVDEESAVTGVVSFADGSHPAMFAVSVGAARPLPFAAADGKFRVDAVPAGRRFVQITGPTLEMRVLDGVELKAGETTDLGTVTVQRGRVVSGRVTDADGRPVAGATVYCGAQLQADGRSVGLFDDVAIKQVVTGADGSYRIAGLGRSSQVVVADHDEQGRSASQVMPAGDGDVQIDLQLITPGALEGRVTKNGQPIETIVGMRPDVGSDVQFSVGTGPDGRYRFDRLAPGRYIAYSYIRRGSEMGGGSGSMTPIEIRSGETAHLDIDVSVGEIHVTLRFESEDPSIEFAYGVLISGVKVDGPEVLTIHEARKRLAEIGPNGVLKEGFMLENRSIDFDGIKPGLYAACATPLDGDPRDPETLEGFQRNAVDTLMYCRPATVAASPQKQELVVPVGPPRR